MSRRRLLTLAAVLIAAAVAAGIAVAGKDKDNKKNFEYAIALWGDLPYSDVQAQVGVPNLIADMNDSEIEFSVHDGDLKAGSATAIPSRRPRAPRRRRRRSTSTPRGSATSTH